MYIRRSWLTVGILVLFFAFLLQPDVVTASVTASMDRFCTELIPVLFPYMVLSHFFCTYRLLDPLSGLLPVGKLFRMDNGAFSAFCMGHVCGYPVGASMTATMVKNKRISPAQGAVLCAVSAGASPAFLIHVVGGNYWGDIRLGLGLFLLQVLSGLLAGWIGGRHNFAVQMEEIREETVPISRCFTEAVGGGAIRTVSIGGYIVFFSLLTALVPEESPFTLPLAAILEFTTGTEMAALTGGNAGLFWTGFASGFGGFSILGQITQMLDGSGVSLAPTICYKGILGIISGLYAIAAGQIFSLKAELSNMYAGHFANSTELLPILMVFAMAVVLCFFTRGTRENR